MEQRFIPKAAGATKTEICNDVNAMLSLATEDELVPDMVTDDEAQIYVDIMHGWLIDAVEMNDEEAYEQEEELVKSWHDSLAVKKSN